MTLIELCEAKFGADTKAKIVRLMANLRASRRRNPTKRVKVIGGPFEGHTLLMTKGDLKTAYMKVGEWAGRYVSSKWENKK